MAENSILPLGQHRLDPAPDFDPVRSLLHRLWNDLFWVGERIATLEAEQENDPARPAQELAYLRGDTDDALQHLARLIELLLAGHVADPQKRIPRGTSPPYFRDGQSVVVPPIVPLGQHRLDPSPDLDPVRFFLEAAKMHLVAVEEGRIAYHSFQDSDPARAERELVRLRTSSADARQHVARLIELVLAGHTVDRARRGPMGHSLRLFKQRTEADWLAYADLDLLCKMLRPLDYGITHRFSERKWRLFGLACVRRVCGAFTDERSRGLVEAVEQLAEGVVTQEELRQLWGQARNPPNHDIDPPESCLSDRNAAYYAFQSLGALPFGRTEASDASQSARWAREAVAQPMLEAEAQIALLRDIFGNPFRSLPPRPVAIAPLAEDIYAGAWNKMPLLGEWLQEHGYWQEGEHCLDPARKHVKGCWVVDWILDKS
jgi:hypothetical protein